MAKLPWGIVWENEPPDTQTKQIEGGISWIIKAIPDEDPMAVEPDESIEPTVILYEVLANNLRDTVVVDETNTGIGVQISGNVGNPFVFQDIGYVTPKGEGFTPIHVSFVEDLPEYSTIDIFSFIPSSVTSQTDTITIRATATDFDGVDEQTYTITGVFEVTTNNSWDNTKQTLDGIVAS